MSQRSTVPRPDKGSMLLRRASHSKMVLKEKIVQIYEALFRGEDPSSGNANFWDEMFLLRANTAAIEAELDKLSGEQLGALKDTFNNLFHKCVEEMTEEHPIRIINAMQTLSALIRGVFKKSRNDCGFEVIDLLIGFDVAEQRMQELVQKLNKLITGEYSPTLRSVALNVLLVLVTATDNISQNTLLEYFMMNSVFESITQLLSSQISRSSFGQDAVLLLTILVQYRKYESANPYVLRLSILDDELALTGYAQIVSSGLTDFNRLYHSKYAEPEGGFFTTLTNMVGSMFVTDEKKIEGMNANDSILLALYEAIHLNRNFITALTHSHTPSAPASPPSTPTTPTPNPANHPLEAQETTSTTLTTPASAPTNLLVTFLEYCSIVLQNTKDPARFCNAKLCLIILTCIAEDQYANSLMHDVNMNFRVPLHKMPMRHRKAHVDKRAPSRPLASALIDLNVEFIQSHLMKNFPTELYLKCLGITQRILCYQKKCRVRLQYHWKDLWTALMNLLKFILSNENYLVKKIDIFHLCTKVINIFNLFITYGDTFLPTPNSYDELYYEIIRVHQTFDNLYSMALRYTTTEGQWKETAVRLTNTLVNVRAIINHFSPKVDSWAAANQLSSLTEEQVLEVVRGNYDSLTLKLQENLDQYERYTEKPRESAFFTQLVRQIAADVRKTTSDVSAQQQKLSDPSKVT